MSESNLQSSPWRGVWVIVAKDMADHLTSVRMLVLELVILLTAGSTVYTALRNIRSTTGNGDFIFLGLFTTAEPPLPAFVGFLGFLIPLLAIALSFDAVNGEFNQRTLPRVISQPIYRDALLLGKFLAGLFTLSLVLASIWLLIIGAGIIGMGVPPSGEETLRMLVFLVLAIFYGGVWQALGLLFSTRTRQPATAALTSISVWILFTVFWSILADLIGQALQPITFGTLDEIIKQTELIQMLTRISPNTLFVEAMLGLLNPAVRSFGIVLPAQLEGALLGAPLPLGESMLLIWPHLTGLISATILIFAIAYVSFQRQEIRA